MNRAKSVYTFTEGDAVLSERLPAPHASVPAPHVSDLVPVDINARLKGNCFYCGTALERVRKGQPQLPNHWTKDHIEPKHKGGRTKVDSCLLCNSEKGRLTLEEWRLVTMFRRGLIHKDMIKSGYQFWGEQK